MARFVTVRPRFAEGSSVPGYGFVRAVLFADAECEVYLLDTPGPQRTLLLCLAQPGVGPVLDLAALAAWIETQGASVAAADASSLIVRLSARWLADVPTPQFSEPELYALILTLIDVAAMGKRFGYRVVPIRPFLWVDRSWRAPQVISIYARRAGVSDEHVVRDLAQTFLCFATGISSLDDEGAADADRLRSWCQHADPQLSRTIARCLEAPAPVTTLAQMRLEIRESLTVAEKAGRIDARMQERFVGAGPYLIGRFLEPHE